MADVTSATPPAQSGAATSAPAVTPPATPSAAITPASTEVAKPSVPPTDSTAPAAAPTPTEATPAAAPAAVVTPPADLPPADLTLPADMQLPKEAVDKFQGFMKGKIVDGKVNIAPQDIVNLFVEQARDANARWATAQAAQAQEWASESKSRFSEKQLTVAKTGVDYLSSFEPSFRDIAKNFLNHPSFVAAMHRVGDALKEDTFEPAGAAPAQARRAAKDILYPKRNGAN